MAQSFVHKYIFNKNNNSRLGKPRSFVSTKSVCGNRRVLLSLQFRSAIFSRDGCWKRILGNLAVRKKPTSLKKLHLIWHYRRWSVGIQDRKHVWRGCIRKGRGGNTCNNIMFTKCFLWWAAAVVLTLRSAGYGKRCANDTIWLDTLHYRYNVHIMYSVDTCDSIFSFV